jgi:polyribonucleotide nucleotidyltransferase
MIEGWADNLEQAKFSEALEFGAKEAFKLVTAMKKIKLEIKEEQIPLSAMNERPAEAKQPSSNDQEEHINTYELIKSLGSEKLYEIITNADHDKFSRDKAISDLRNVTVNKALKMSPTSGSYQELSDVFVKYVKRAVRELGLNESKRVDGRTLNQIRPISCQVNVYNSLHGSALFQRGQTQVLSSITFDSPDSMYRQDSIFSMMSPSITNFNKNFMLHYEFPSFATNEISKVGGRADRREIGHGALAEKSVYPLFPEDHPFTVRSLCEVLESNGFVCDTYTLIKQIEFLE